jgi:hypothetical protein
VRVRHSKVLSTEAASWLRDEQASGSPHAVRHNAIPLACLARSARLRQPDAPSVAESCLNRSSAAPLARRQRRPLALGAPADARRACVMHAPPISRLTQRRNRSCAVPSSRRFIVPLPATVSRSLPAVASQTVGFAEPRHGTRSPGFGACGKTERTGNPNPLLPRRPHERPQASASSGELRTCCQ